MARLRAFGPKDDYSAVYTKPSYWPNIIFNPNFKLAQLDHRIKELVQAHQNGQGPKYIMTNPTSTESEIVMGLKHLGLKAGSWTAMTRSLNHLPSYNHPTLEIERVNTSNQLDEWLSVINEVLMDGKAVTQKLFDQNLNDSRFQLFVGRLNGRPIATSMAFTTHKTCGIYLVATSPKYQGQGIGSDMTLKAMNAGQRAECEKAVLQATQKGYKVYLNLGFEDCGEISVFDITKHSLG